MQISVDSDVMIPFKSVFSLVCCR